MHSTNVLKTLGLAISDPSATIRVEGLQDLIAWQRLHCENLVGIADALRHAEPSASQCVRDNLETVVCVYLHQLAGAMVAVSDELAALSRAAGGETEVPAQVFAGAVLHHESHVMLLGRIAQALASVNQDERLETLDRLQHAVIELQLSAGGVATSLRSVGASQDMRFERADQRLH